MLWLPTARDDVVNDALAPASVADPSSDVPSQKVMDPVSGWVPDPWATAAVNVTAWPLNDGSTLDVRPTVGAPTGLTTRISVISDVAGFGFAESVTRTVKLAVPVAVGVPETKPVEAR